MLNTAMISVTNNYAVVFYFYTGQHQPIDWDIWHIGIQRDKRNGKPQVGMYVMLFTGNKFLHCVRENMHVRECTSICLSVNILGALDWKK